MIKNYRKIYRLADICYFTLAGTLTIVPIIASVSLAITGLAIQEGIKKSYNDNAKFIEACLNDNYLRRLYNERMEPAKLQYEKGEISQKDLMDIENQYIEEVKTTYSVYDYAALSGEQEEYEHAETLVNAGGYTVLGATVSSALGTWMLIRKDNIFLE